MKTLLTTALLAASFSVSAFETELFRTRVINDTDGQAMFFSLSDKIDKKCSHGKRRAYAFNVETEAKADNFMCWEISRQWIYVWWKNRVIYQTPMMNVKLMANGSEEEYAVFKKFQAEISNQMLEETRRNVENTRKMMSAKIRY